MSSAAVDDLWQRHVVDSLQLADFVPADADSLLDLGSGGGFPGLVLAIAVPGRRIHVVEADKRKAAFLSHAVLTLELPNVTVIPERIEAVDLLADVVTARAVAPLPRLLDLAAPHLKEGGVALFPKGKGVEKELTDALLNWTMSVERFASRTDEHGVILRLSEIARREPPSA